MTHNRNAIPSTTPLLNDASKDIFTCAISNAGGVLTTVTLGALSNTCHFFHRLFQDTLTFRNIQAVFLQAVVDNDQMAATKILDANLNRQGELLLTDPKYGIAIESKLTGQKFYAENPLAMAAKRKQINMIECLLPYYEKLTRSRAVSDVIADGLSSWRDYDIQKNANGEDEIIIPKEYTDFLESLITIVSREKFSKGKLSKPTEEGISECFNRLIPLIPVKLDDYLDVELFLLAAYKSYLNENVLDEQGKRIFCIHVIGLIQSVLSPEIARMFCQGLEVVVKEITKGKKITELTISEQARQYQLKSGESFYHPSRDSHLGMGFKFLCDVYGSSVCLETAVLDAFLFLQHYLGQKQQFFVTLRSQYNVNETSNNSIPIMSSRAV